MPIPRKAPTHQGEMGKARSENRTAAAHDTGELAEIRHMFDIRMGQEEIRQAQIPKIDPHSISYTVQLVMSFLQPHS